MRLRPTEQRLWRCRAPWSGCCRGTPKNRAAQWRVKTKTGSTTVQGGRGSCVRGAGVRACWGRGGRRSKLHSGAMMMVMVMIMMMMVMMMVLLVARFCIGRLYTLGEFIHWENFYIGRFYTLVGCLCLLQIYCTGVCTKTTIAARSLPSTQAAILCARVKNICYSLCHSCTGHVESAATHQAAAARAGAAGPGRASTGRGAAAGRGGSTAGSGGRGTTGNGCKAPWCERGRIAILVHT